MKAQMRFQKYMCLVMLLMGALGLLYSFFYMSGSMAELGQAVRTVVDPNTNEATRQSLFTAAEGKYDYELYNAIQPFNNAMMYCGIVMVLLAVALYITSSHSRRNYYISNYVATGLCAGGNIIISIVLMAFNAIWRGRFLNVDFDAWYKAYESYILIGADDSVHYSTSTTWFDIGFAVYAIIIVASVFLILNLVWKIKLMQGEKKLLNGGTVAGGAAV